MTDPKGKRMTAEFLEPLLRHLDGFGGGRITAASTKAATAIRELLSERAALEAENKTLRDERDAVTALLRKVPLPPLAITWEAGNKLLDELQAMAVARSGA